MSAGTLSVDEIGRGMHKAYVNARGLVEDAEVLLDARPARSISLAVLAMEEIGKVVLLAEAAAQASAQPVEWRALRKDLDLLCHAQKQAVFAGYGKAILDRLATTRGKPTHYCEDVPAGIGPLLDWMKQMGFYTDAVQGQFISPDEFGRDNAEWAQWLVSVARERVDSFEALHETEASSVRVARMATEASACIDEVRTAETEEEARDAIRALVRRIAETT